jgi:hypothetical protein
MWHVLKLWQEGRQGRGRPCYLTAIPHSFLRTYSRWNMGVFGLLLLLSGCMVGPDYHAPCIDFPESFRYELPNSNGDLEVKWWMAFEDAVLNALVEEALLNNKDVQIAAANIDYAVGILIQVRAPLLPQIGYNGSYTRLRTSETLASTFSFFDSEPPDHLAGCIDRELGN